MREEEVLKGENGGIKGLEEALNVVVQECSVP